MGSHVQTVTDDFSKGSMGGISQGQDTHSWLIIKCLFCSQKSRASQLHQRLKLLKRVRLFEAIPCKFITVRTNLLITLP
jgi:hypothetical protein